MGVDHQLTARRGSFGGVEEAVQEITGLLRDVLRRQYPHPLSFTRVRAPLDYDSVFVNFVEPVSVPVMIYPDYMGLRIDVGETWNTFTVADIGIDKRRVSSVKFYNRYWIASLYDTVGTVGLVYLTSQKFANAVKRVQVISKQGGAVWLAKIITTTEDVRNSEEAKVLRPTDLLDTDYKTSEMAVVFYGLHENVDYVRLWLDSDTFNVEVSTVDKRIYEVNFRLDGGEVIDIEPVRGGQTGREAIEALLSRLDWRELIRNIEVATKEFLEDYKYFMVALSLLNLLS